MQPSIEIYLLGALILVLVVGYLPMVSVLGDRPRTDEEARDEAQKTRERERRLLRLCGMGGVLILAVLLVTWIVS
ncbi:hypothetical protein BGE01nite_19700 [Brevifollis gellanilyticus]|uniref:Uncharacterized protein n=1 Tax=Brevifollis gellanilyticus TaxID=748831 RepID=A0A512M7G9_9BACT|nr:hypothetical protein BGE01nite_19700 [Brevifollis gellanilyticus]